MACKLGVNIVCRSKVPHTRAQMRSGSLDLAYLMVDSNVDFPYGDSSRDSMV